MIHNVIVVDGQEYKAVKDVNDNCDRCALIGTGSPCGTCLKSERADNTSAVYKPHYKLSNKNE